MTQAAAVTGRKTRSAGRKAKGAAKAGAKSAGKATGQSRLRQTVGPFGRLAILKVRLIQRKHRKCPDRGKHETQQHAAIRTGDGQNRPDRHLQDRQRAHPPILRQMLFLKQNDPREINDQVRSGVERDFVSPTEVAGQYYGSIVGFAA